ncbi:hypothetical protein FT663_04526 [Candidozyma haemuli var. vulneris]|uniref:Exosome complex component CSL4 C-terminal domain-containing protein n=1 Tax=Candidozyma haemuli TaxID=45357 RepID=A0A2V1ALT3_9ASCO|nr:hypothetical protein CXQ85_001562 [[Candida] haemuloni]KAF3986478.1 hypothetical protein FT662_04545 [[Candida] haemuloni var. vulneris]KAF3987267.1 hypothetical protein FT663_04526 [[Candida] haemuloni var. vulneris]PVH19257.1 hypothetical protein CXQ85_001562 [[Candida] haemuloni]
MSQTDQKVPQTAVPGQYLMAAVKDENGVVHRYFPGKGTVSSTVQLENEAAQLISATVLGSVVIQQLVDKKEEEEEEEAKKEKQFLVSVIPGTDYTSFAKEVDSDAQAAVSATATNLPREGDVVLVKVIRLNPRQATCEILCVEGSGNVSADSGMGSNGTSAQYSVPMGGGSQLLSSYGAVASFQGSLAGAQPVDVGEAFRGLIRSQDVRSTERDKVKIVDCFRPGDVVRASVLSLGDGSNYYLTTARNDLGVIFAKSEGGAGERMVAIDWETMVCEKTGVTEKRKCAKLFA